jgi:hypothetical protein
LFPSSHGAPTATGFEHTPVALLHTPTVWHASMAVQVTGIPAVQTPIWQVSAPLQAFPSLQPIPLPIGVWVHVPSGPQASAVQGLPSSQLTVPAQTPFVHLSPSVQLLLSLQPVPSMTLV